MARVIRWCLAALLGSLTVSMIYCWPVRPLWVVDGPPKPQTQRVAQISPDGRSLFTLVTSIRGGTPALCRWDLDTGALEQRLELNDPVLSSANLSLRLSPDCKTLFAGENYFAPKSADDSWHLFDARTGERRGLPFHAVAHFNPGAESLDGRWFWVYPGNRADPKPASGLDVISQETGERVVQFRSQDGMTPTSMQFAKDGNTAVVAWAPTDRSKQSSILVKLLEFPSGKELKRY